MTSPEPSERYSDVAIALHWLLAVAWVAAFFVGLYMTGLKLSPSRIRLFNWHKWAGVSILLLSVFRLGWRWTHRAPALPVTLGALQRGAAEWTHRLMYLLFFLIPLSGWAYSSAVGFPVVWFGKIPLPDFVPVDKDLARFFQQAHAISSYLIAALVALHAAAAMEHHFLRRDTVLTSMLPARGRAAVMDLTQGESQEHG
jgi:cytochrome b561